MKKILSTLVAMVCATATFAQVSEVQTATLIHADKTSLFYGRDALKNAYDAAADTADVIILSNGTFNHIDIAKSISIYGAGMDSNADLSLTATIIESGLQINEAEYYDDYGEKQLRTPSVHLEGLYIQGGYNYGTYGGLIVNNPNKCAANLNIVKCYLYRIEMYGELRNAAIRQSHIDGFGAGNHKMENVNISNSIIRVISWVPVGSSMNIDHCIIKEPSYLGYYTNNVIYGAVAAESTCYNNIFVGNASIGTPNVQENNWFNIDNEVLWAVEGEDGSYGPTKTYELKFPKKYVGTDGTVVGPAGGQYPWNVVPSLPRVISSDIDARVAADGKLKVSLKVEAQTKE